MLTSVRDAGATFERLLNNAPCIAAVREHRAMRDRAGATCVLVGGHGVGKRNVVDSPRFVAAPLRNTGEHAVRAFEAWIVGGDPGDVMASPDSDGGWNDRLRDWHGVYSETADRPRLVDRIDPGLLVQRSRSFARLQQALREPVGLFA